jgi:hypothetical protein
VPDKTIVCECGWSRRVARTVRRERRLQILAEHKKIHEQKKEQS